MKLLDRWLLIAIGSHILLFLEKSGGISFYEILYTIIFYPGLFIWFLYKWWSGSAIIYVKSDLSIFFFLIVGFISIFISSIGDGEFLKGIREWLLFVPYLLYFPLRDYIVDFKNFKKILLIIITMGTLLSLINIIRYYTSLGFAQYLFEIWGRRQALEESLYMSSIIFGIMLLAAGESPKYFLFFGTLLNIISLAFTFSRGYWISTSFGIILIILLSEWKIKRRLITLGFVAIFFIALVIVILFPGLFSAIREGLIMRIASIGYGDISIQTRLSESLSVIKLILLNPLIGYGFGSIYSYYDLILQHYKMTWYIHNGYLFILYKVGVLGFIFYFWFYISKSISVIKNRLFEEHKSIKSILYCILSIPVIMLLLSFSSPQFYDRASVLVLTIVWGAAAGLGKRLNTCQRDKVL